MPFTKKIFLSCSSFDFYTTVYKDNYKKTLKTILLFLLIAGFFNSLAQYMMIKREVTNLENWALKTTPIFSQGELNLKSPDIYSIEKNNFIFIIDPNNSAEIIPEKYPVGIMFTKKNMVLKNKDQQAKHPYKKNEKDLIFDKDTIDRYKATFFSLLTLFVLPGGIILFTLFKLLYILAFSLLTLVYLNLFKQFKNHFDFKKVLNICSFATIPPTIFFLIFFTLNQSVANLIYFGMHIAFIIGAISKIKEALPQEPDIENII